LGRSTLVIAAIWALIGFYVVHSQLPSSTVELPGQDSARVNIQTVAPQGWAFFTKSPREPNPVAWAPDAGGDWQTAMFAPHSEPRNAFGLNRRSRAQPVEIGLLTSALPPERWLDCGHGDIPACLAEAEVVVVDNPSPEPLLCGPVGVSRQTPLPWAWADAADRTNMPASVVRLDVRC
jgi:antimicrobial peptide system SdpA family protein